MEMIIEEATDAEELASFLAKLNTQKKYHIGFCGSEKEEIQQTLYDEFTSPAGELDFLIGRDGQGQLIAAIGLDKDEESAEVWGPFHVAPSVDTQEVLWKEAVTRNADIKDFNFFINKENERQQLFMDAIQATKTGKHLILEVKEKDFHPPARKESVVFKKEDFLDFERLHSVSFPGTYYNAETIVERLNEKNVLRVLKNDEELQGYAYYEVDDEFGDASLEYISISPEFQHQGLGTILLKEVLAEMFRDEKIESIRLVVENTNNKANRLYLNAGFTHRDMLFSYRFTR